MLPHLHLRDAGADGVWRDVVGQERREKEHATCKEHPRHIHGDGMDTCCRVQVNPGFARGQWQGGMEGKGEFASKCTTRSKQTHNHGKEKQRRLTGGNHLAHVMHG